MGMKHRPITASIIGIAALSAICLADASAAAGREITAAQLRAACEAKLPLCTGYVEAISDVFAESSIAGLRACIPDDASTSAKIDKVVAALPGNPDFANFPHLLVARALTEAYPCHGPAKGQKAPKT
jgi:hypothetical protein